MSAPGCYWESANGRASLTALQVSPAPPYSATAHVVMDGVTSGEKESSSNEEVTLNECGHYKRVKMKLKRSYWSAIPSHASWECSGSSSSASDSRARRRALTAQPSERTDLPQHVGSDGDRGPDGRVDTEEHQPEQHASPDGQVAELSRERRRVSTEPFLGHFTGALPRLSLCRAPSRPSAALGFRPAAQVV